MESIVDPLVNQFLRNLQGDSEPFLKEMVKYAEDNNIPIIEPEVASFLSFLIKLKSPRSILEIGTAIGYSTLIMKRASPNSRLVTIEISESKARLARRYVERSGYQDIDIKIGDACDLLDELEGSFDFIFIDAAKGHYQEYFDKSEKLLNRDGLIVCDNVLFKGMVANEKYLTTNHRKKTIVRRLHQFIYDLLSNDRFDTSIIPIDDGMSLSRLKS